MAIDTSRKFVLETATELDKFEAIFQWGDSREKIGDVLRSLLDERDRLQKALRGVKSVLDGDLYGWGEDDVRANASIAYSTACDALGESSHD